MGGCSESERLCNAVGTSAIEHEENGGLIDPRFTAGARPYLIGGISPVARLGLTSMQLINAIGRERQVSQQILTTTAFERSSSAALWRLRLTQTVTAPGGLDPSLP